MHVGDNEQVGDNGHVGEHLGDNEQPGLSRGSARCDTAACTGCSYIVCIYTYNIYVYIYIYVYVYIYILYKIDQTCQNTFEFVEMFGKNGKLPTYSFILSY